MKKVFWNYYSHFFTRHILSPRHCGVFDVDDTFHQNVRIVRDAAGEVEGSGRVLLSLAVDLTDGMIIDAKFRAYGESILIGVADMVCEDLVQKSYSQAKCLSVDFKSCVVGDIHEFFEKVIQHVDIILEAIGRASSRCADIPLIKKHPTPFSLPPHEEGKQEGGFHGWHDLTCEEKLDMIKLVVREEIQPYVELDAGGVEVLSLRHDREVIIAYHGACATCPAATGSTLDAVQNVLRTRLSPTLCVIPDPSFLFQE